MNKEKQIKTLNKIHNYTDMEILFEINNVKTLLNNDNAALNVLRITMMELGDEVSFIPDSLLLLFKNELKDVLELYEKTFLKRRNN